MGNAAIAQVAVWAQLLHRPFRLKYYLPPSLLLQLSRLNQR